MLATSGGVADEASIISIEKVVDGDGGLRESETKILPGAEGVRESAAELWRSVVVRQGELDEGVVDATIGVGDVEPSYS